MACHMPASVVACVMRLVRRGRSIGDRRQIRDVRGEPDTLARLVNSFATGGSPPEVLYLGDSVAERVSRSDRDTRTLGEMVSWCVDSRCSVACISRSGYHMGVFRGVARALAAMPTRPKVMILPVNMRSFSPQWDRRPMWQFGEEISALERYATYPQEAIPRIIEQDETDAELARYDQLAVQYPMTEFGTIGEFREAIAWRPSTTEQRQFRLRQIFMFHYMHPLVANHRRLEALKDVLSAMRAMGVAGVVYITPVNYQAGTRHVGTGFQRQLRSNVEIVREVMAPFERSGCLQMLDWSTVVESRGFFHENEPTEHLNEVGRLRLARAIADAVLGIVRWDRDP